MGAGDEEAEGLPGSLLVTKVEGKDPGRGSGSPRWAHPGPLIPAGLCESQKGQMAKARKKSTKKKKEKHQSSRCLGTKEIIRGRKF